jgi:hypothetical protein
MQEFLSKFVGRHVDVHCGASSSLRGEVLRVEAGVLHLKDNEDRLCFVAIDKIVVVWEAREDEHRAGFVSPNLR